MYIRINGRVIKRRNGAIKIGTGIGSLQRNSNGKGVRTTDDNVEKLIDNISNVVRNIKLESKTKTPKVTERKYIKF